MNLTLPNTPGTCFRFTVASADQAAQVIREQLGDNVRVLSVRTVPSRGFSGLFGSSQLEVVAQVATPVAPAAAPETVPSVRPDTSRRYGAPGAGFASDQNLSRLLRRAGFSAALVQRLEQSPAWVSLNELPLHRALVETGRHLCELAAARHEAVPLHRAAFLGTAGVGRTTALCKWLAGDLFRRARLGHVVTAEFDRPSPTGPLSVFCEAMGVPLAHFPASTEPATPGGFVYFDMPGLSLRNPAENEPIRAFLAQEKIEQRVLVLNANYDAAALRKAYAAGRDLGATHVVFTHLDEVTQWGRLWDFILEGELIPLFLATGPSLTGECEEDVAGALARRTLPAGPIDEEAEIDESAAETDQDASTQPSTLNTAA